MFANMDSYEYEYEDEDSVLVNVSLGKTASMGTDDSLRRTASMGAKRVLSVRDKSQIGVVYLVAARHSDKPSHAPSLEPGRSSRP